MTDDHVHIGHYYGLSTSSQRLIKYLCSVNIGKFAVSSTTTCEENYLKVISELKDLLAIADNQALPVLWITPRMIQTGALFSMFEQGIDWKCLKIHPQLHPDAWLQGSAYLDLVVSIASIYRLPLLIHSGDMPGCYPLLYEEVISRRKDVVFILAHGRPLDQTITLMKKYDNVWCDTAFMPVEHIVTLCGEGLANRVLWGSDYPILKYYNPEANLKKLYLDKVKSLRNQIDIDSFRKITEGNFNRLFSI